MGFSIDVTSDDGYIVLGTAFYPVGGGAWLMKLDGNGNIKWKRLFGGFGVSGESVQQTSDGGYVIATDGMSVIKTDSRGKIEWTYTPSRECWTWGDRVIQETSDGGFVVVGTTYNETTAALVYLIKLDRNGEEEWSRLYGGLIGGNGHSVYPTSDGGFVIAGRYLAGEDGSEGRSVWLIKVDENGNIEWSKNFGKTLSENSFCVQQTSDGGYHRRWNRERHTWCWLAY